MKNLIQEIFIAVLLLNIGIASAWSDGYNQPAKCSFKDDNLSMFFSVGSFMFERVSTGFGIRGKKIGVEIGFATPLLNRRNQLVGGNPTLDYRCPHNDYTAYEPAQDIYCGLDGLYFLNLSKRVSLYTGFGVYVSDVRQRVRSNATGWIYDHGSVGSVFGVNPQIGIQFFVGKDGDYFGINFGLLRGLSISYGAKRN